jgi:hypothetical protein
MNLSKKILSILLSLLLVMPLSSAIAGRAYAQTPGVYLNPTLLELTKIGDGGTAEVTLANVPASAGFEFALSFNKDIIQVTAVDLLAPPAGVNLIPLKSINNEMGVVTFGGLVTCDAGVCPNILSGSPVVLATLTVSAVGEGTGSLVFDSAYTLYGTEVGANDLPVRLEATLTNGQVKVGETPSERPTINLAAGGNIIVWPAGLGDLTSLSATSGLSEDCGGTVGVSRRKNGRWESAVSGYGGDSFALTEGAVAYVRVGSGCVWSP